MFKLYRSPRRSGIGVAGGTDFVGTWGTLLDADAKDGLNSMEGADGSEGLESSPLRNYSSSFGHWITRLTWLTNALGGFWYTEAWQY